MDPKKAWDDMLRAYEAGCWQESLELSEGLRDRMESGGFGPMAPVATSTGVPVEIRDERLMHAIALAACHHIFEQSLLHQGDNG